MSTENYAPVVQNLEKAAEIILNPSTSISNEDRHAAESYFLELKKLKSPYALCRSVFETSSNSFVIYELTVVIREAVLREWLLLDSTDIENIWQYLMDYVCGRPNLPNFVTGEMLMTVSTFVKRGTFDGKSGDTSKIFDTVGKMIASNDVHYLSLACQLLLNLCGEYCTCWRSSNVGITWDFHIRAKRHFENSDLKRILEMVLQVLHYVMSEEANRANFLNSNRDFVVLLMRVLNVGETVLNWNFGSKYLPKRLTYSVEFSPAVSFHPPDSWRPILLNPEALQLFFRLHAAVRENEQLCRTSLQCLVQLASLSGPVFSDAQTRQQYLEYFVTNFVLLFPNEPSTNEAVDFGHIVQKLFCFHSISEIIDLPSSLVGEFLSLVTRITCQFCCKAVEESLKEADDPVYQEAYGKILDGWAVQLKSGSGAADEQLYLNSAVEIFDCFCRCHLSPPTGIRPSALQTGECDDMIEDRLKYFDVLVNVGIVGRCSLDRSLNQLYCLLTDRILNYQLLVQEERNVADAALQNLQEDLHWLLLVSGFILTSEDIEQVYLVHLDVLHYSSKLSNEKRADVDASKSYLRACLTLATDDVDLNSVDPVVKLIGCVLRWASVELRLLTTDHVGALSPQVAQTTFWCLRRLLCAFSEQDEGLANALPCVARMLLQSGSEFSSMLIRFILENFFVVLSRWAGEIQLTKEIVSLLLCFVETGRADEVGKDSLLLSELSKIQVQNLSPSTRKDLVRSLVKIGASTESTEVHEQLYTTILDPIFRRYQTILSSNDDAFVKQTASSTMYSDLVDLLDCFGGVAKAVQEHSAKILFNYLAPILESSSALLASCKNNQTVVDAVLQLYVDVSQKLVMFLNDNNDAQKVYADLLKMLRTYADNNLVKYVSAANLDEEKTSDVVLVLHILTNLLSKDVFKAVAVSDNVLTSNDGVSAASVTLMGLEILMPLMNRDLLKYPNVCNQYFKLITFAVELHSEIFCTHALVGNTSTMKQNILESINLGLSFEFGIETVKLSLDFLNALATFVCQQMDVVYNELKNNLASFMPCVFETCLKASSDVELLNDASVTLFSLICCDQAVYKKFVEHVISSHKDSVVKEKLTTSFSSLLSSEYNVSRQKQTLVREKRGFRDRFEIFLNEIQGLLCI